MKNPQIKLQSLKKAIICTSLTIVAFLVLTPRSQAGTVHHRVACGETLQKISMKYFCTTRKWHDIFQQNKAILPTPNAVEPGMDLSFEGPAKCTDEEASASAAASFHAHNHGQGEKREDSRQPASIHVDGIGGGGDPADAQIGAPLVQPDYVTDPKRTPRGDSESDARGVTPSHTPEFIGTQELIELVAKTTAEAVAGAERIQPNLKPLYGPDFEETSTSTSTAANEGSKSAAGRKIASVTPTTMTSIDPAETAEVEDIDIPAHDHALAPDTAQITQKLRPVKTVHYRFGSKTLLGPEL